MVVYEKTSRFAFHMLNETKSKVRISENAYKNGGNLQEEPMQRAYDALCNFIQIAKSYKARKILCVATSALRDAPNKTQFLQRVRQGLGLNIKVIDGTKEALYGGIAAANLLPTLNNAITVDIGGGSTEFSRIEKKDVQDPISLNLGAVRIKELFFDHDDIEGAKKYIDNELDKLHNSAHVDTIVGIGGSFRALATALMEDESYPFEKLHGYEIDAKRLKKLLEKVLQSQTKDLKKLHIKEERLDVIKPGALILLRIMKKLHIKHIITSGVGVREGAYLWDLLRNANHRFPENYNPSVRYLLDAYVFDKRHSTLLAQTAKKIFDLTATHLGLDPSYRYHVGLSAKLYPVGSAIHYYSKNKHSYYIIQANLEYGFSHYDTMLIATLNRYAKRKLPSKTHYEKYKKLLPQKEVLDQLSFIVSVAVALLTHRPQHQDFDMRFNDGVLYIIEKESCLRVSQEAVEKLNYIKDFEIKFL
jgi:exopolyphosphatase/guanosine-5'-triphosphate,3'-diphosphate pyrophosphatase